MVMYITLLRDLQVIRKCKNDNIEVKTYKTVKELIDGMNEGDTVMLSSMYMLSDKRVEVVRVMRIMLEKKIRFIALDIPMTLRYECRNKSFQIIIETVESILKYERIIHSGRPRRMEPDEFGVQYERVLRGEISPTELIAELNIPVGTYYRYKKEYDKELREKRG